MPDADIGEFKDVSSDEILNTPDVAEFGYFVKADLEWSDSFEQTTKKIWPQARRKKTDCTIFLD